jgi:hypothetical protein
MKSDDSELGKLSLLKLLTTTSNANLIVALYMFQD